MSNDTIVPGFSDENDETLKITLQDIPEIEGGLLLVLTGYIDTYNSTYFQKRIQQAIDAGFIRLIFNCSGLNYVSSTGIGSFTAFLKTVKAKGGDLVLLEVQPKVYEVFQLLGFSQFFNIRETLDSSIGFFSNNEGKNGSEIFPKIVSCPNCSKDLKAVKSGRFRCSECKSILDIDTMGNITLG